MAVSCDSTDPLPPNPCEVTPGSCAAVLNQDITASRTLHSDTVYTLGSYVHVTGNGTVLTIEPGTTIKGTISSALFILQGARIDAQGTATQPIVLTSDQAVGSRKPGDWGGLILVGKGVINRSDPNGILLEGTGPAAPNYTVTYSGGNDNADNSGIMRYVRVEFAGFGVQPNQELNSFTFAAVGSGTTLEYLQAMAGADDSFEWFGGAVDGKYLVSYEAGDDHFDSAEGYVGRNQFLIGFQSIMLPFRAGQMTPSTDPQGFEIDGCGSSSGGGCPLGFLSTPLNTPMYANFTMVGTGPNTDVASTSGGIGMVIRRGTAGMYVNGVVARWPRAGISLRDEDTRTQFTTNAAVLRNVYVAEIGTAAGTNSPTFEGGTACPTAPTTTCRFTIDQTANVITTAAGTVTAASLFTALPAAATVPTAATLDWSLAASVAPRTGGTGGFSGSLATKAGTFVTGTSYQGAHDPSAATKWWTGWTTYVRN